MVEQVAVFAAQVEKAPPRADDERAQRHPGEDAIGIRGQQHPVLERSRLALVGIADDVMRVARRVAAGFPFLAGRETRATPTAQVRRLDLGEQAVGPAGEGGGERATRVRIGCQHDVLAADVVVDPEEFRRPRRHRGRGANQLADRVDARLRQTGDCDVVDEHRRSLVAHSGAGRGVDADEAVLGDLPALDPELPAHVLEQLHVAQHPIGDVVAEQHPIPAARLRVQERIEAGDAFDLGARQAHDFLHPVDGFRRDPVAGLLHLAQDLHEVARVFPVAPEHRVDRRPDRLSS